MRAIKFSFLATLVAIGLLALRSASATSPFTPQYNDANENMENDTDSYTPTDRDPIADPDLDGDTPGAGAASTGLPFGSAGSDATDIRTTGPGVFEEVPSGFDGTAAAPDGSAHVAILQFEGANGVFTRVNRDRFTPISAFPSGRYWASIDMYIDPSIAYNNLGAGTQGFWWDIAVNGDATSYLPNSYLSETSTRFTVNPSGLTWDVTADATSFATIPVGGWLGFEIEPIPSVANPGLVAFEHRVTNALHTVTLASYITEDYLGGGAGNYSQLTGPRYSWFPDHDAGFGGANAAIFLDNVGWASPVEVPEPSTLVLAGFGVIGLVVAARRRRAKA